MASLYKKPIITTDPATGQRVKAKSQKWWGRFRDANGKEKRVPLANDKPAAQAMLSRLVKRAEQLAAGITDPYEEHRKRLLTEHAKDFINYLRNKGNTRAYTVQTEQRVKSVLKACRFTRISEISASRVQEYLGDMKRKGSSISTCNHYLRAFKMFTRWLVKDRRSPDNAIMHLSTRNVETDRRKVRRPLSPEEFERLLNAAHSGPSLQEVDGEDRAVLYIIACYTGFRRNEISSLTRRSLDATSDPPTLTVEAAYSKHRRTDVIPLRKDVAVFLQDWIDRRRGTSPDAPLLNIRNKRTAEMLRTDLLSARDEWLAEADTPADETARKKSSFLTYVDDAGRVADFHALRKTFITNLCRAGVSPKAAQVLARHSDINLTMNVYTMLSVHDQASAVEALPPIPQQRKTNKDSAGGNDPARRAS